MSQPTPAPKKRGPAKGDPRCVAAGKRGGAKLLEQRGTDYYRQMGKKGGSTTLERLGHEHFAEIGHKGGERLKEARGIEFYASIGRLGNRSRRPQA